MGEPNIDPTAKNVVRFQASADARRFREQRLPEDGDLRLEDRVERMFGEGHSRRAARHSADVAGFPQGRSYRRRRRKTSSCTMNSGSRKKGIQVPKASCFTYFAVS